MNFYDFCKFVIQHIGKPPDAKRYSGEISLDSTIWSEIKNLAKFTSQFNYEHSITLFIVDKDIIATPPVKGSKSDVHTQHQVNLKYKPKNKNFYEKQILLNGKLVKKSYVRITDIPRDSQIISLFNIHSHPSTISDGIRHYNFFSSTDLNTLFSSQSLCIGLVTDKFFLACRHSQSPRYLSEEQRQILDQINFDFYNAGKLQNELLEKLALVFYEGEFSKKLQRLNK